MVAKDLLCKYHVGLPDFNASGFASLCKRVATNRSMKLNEGDLLLAFRQKGTTEEEKTFIMGMIEEKRVKKPEPEPGNRMDFVTAFDIRTFSSPTERYRLNFSPARYSMSYLFKGYLDGSIKKTKKTKKTEIARFGKLDGSAAQNLSAALREDSNRKPTFEFMSICCMYFKVEPIFAITLFHQCKGMEDLSSYPYIGAALYLFLADETYDYELFVKTCCQAIKADDQELPEAVEKSRYWKTVFEETA